MANDRLWVTRYPTGSQPWQVELVRRSWCFRYGLVVEDDRANDGQRIDHYDLDSPCPGPHGEMYAAAPTPSDPQELTP